MKQVIVNYDEATSSLSDLNGLYISPIPAGFKTVDPDVTGDLTLQLVKQGVTVDEIIKLKNADLI